VAVAVYTVLLLVLVVWLWIVQEETVAGALQAE
jgi:hypothetical protein